MSKRLLPVLVVAMPLAAMGQLWSQPLTSVEGFFSDGYSTNGSQNARQTVADNFTITSNATVSSIQFWGGSGNEASPDLANFSSFDFYVFDSTFSSTVCHTNAATAGLNATPTGQTNSLGGHEYTMVLNTSFNLAPGQYWLGIGSVNASPSGDSFIWSDGASTSQGGQGDGGDAANLFNGQGWTIFPTDPDRAFVLNPVPEPASMAVLALGLAALLRRRKASA
jgi:hypothetical protein